MRDDELEIHNNVTFKNIRNKQPYLIALKYHVACVYHPNHAHLTIYKFAAFCQIMKKKKLYPMLRRTNRKILEAQLRQQHIFLLFNLTNVRAQKDQTFFVENNTFRLKQYKSFFFDSQRFQFWNHPLQI